MWIVHSYASLPEGSSSCSLGVQLAGVRESLSTDAWNPKPKDGFHTYMCIIISIYIYIYTLYIYILHLYIYIHTIYIYIYIYSRFHVWKIVPIKPPFSIDMLP